MSTRKIRYNKDQPRIAPDKRMLLALALGEQGLGISSKDGDERKLWLETIREDVHIRINLKDLCFELMSLIFEEETGVYVNPHAYAPGQEGLLIVHKKEWDELIRNKA